MQKRGIFEKIKTFFAAKIALIKQKIADFKAKRKMNKDVRAEKAAVSGGVADEEQLPEIYLPETTEDFVWLVKKMPTTVLSKKEKAILAGCMAFSSKQVRDVMTPKDEVNFLREDDFMGPLTLDRLYKSGYAHFPVLNNKDEIAGILHTESLNSLEVRETDRASSYLDEDVCYMRDTYSLEQAVQAFLRTGAPLFVVVNQGAQVVGLLCLSDVLGAMIGEIPEDDFSQDRDLTAVAKRGLGEAYGSGYMRKSSVVIQSVGARNPEVLANGSSVLAGGFEKRGLGEARLGE